MERNLTDARYVRTALFKDGEELSAALQDVKAAGLSAEQLSLYVLFEKRRGEPPRLGTGDGKRGLLLGLFCGALVGLFASLICAKLGLLPGFFEDTPLFAVLGGMLFGGLGGGLYGMGLRALPIGHARLVPEQGDCLVTARAIDLATILQVEDIFRRHHALSSVG